MNILLNESRNFLKKSTVMLYINNNIFKNE